MGSCCCDDEVAGCRQGLEGGLDERPVALLLGRACDEHDGLVDLVEPLRWLSVFGGSRSDEPVRGRPFIPRVVELLDREIQHQRSQGEGITEAFNRWQPQRGPDVVDRWKHERGEFADDGLTEQPVAGVGRAGPSSVEDLVRRAAHLLPAEV